MTSTFDKLIYNQKINMEYKSNFNRLHYLINEKFKDVEVFEKSSANLGKYIEIVIHEGLDCKIIIKKKDLESSIFGWQYYPNPEASQTIQRVSSIDNFTNTIEDILSNKRFDIEYLNKSK